MGLAPQNLRLTGANAQPDEPGADIMVEVANDGPDLAGLTEKNDVLRIEGQDGSVVISLDGRPIEEDRKKDTGWFSDLSAEIGEIELGRIADELLKGIDADISSRKEWVEALTQGVSLLGLQVEIPGLQGASDGAPVEGMSKVRHPLLLEACLRFQANARAEMLPTDGPVKIRDDASPDPASMIGHNGGPPLVGATPEQDQLADALELDLNHFLTSTASEYYPDTDRMFFKLGFGGMAFKKVYFCPLRGRPVSETVDADDLIVNNAATDLRNAKRVTHRSMMRPSTIKRLQILGVYRDIALSDPSSPELDSFQRKEKEQQGIQPDSTNPEDRDREIYECYCELNVLGYEHKINGKVTGLEIPYRVTIDVSAKQILSIVRNYDEDDAELPEPRDTFVKYTFVPGLGFCDIGLLHILGNTANAVTAAWREMLDNGMYANFPGFLISKQASRQNTSITRVPPGGAGQVDTMGVDDIRKAIMPLPYTTGQMPPLMALVQDMQTQGQRVGGTSELQVGEGRQDAPVGTTLALIDQATKILNSVHKRMHASQAQEFKLLVREFREHPEAIVNRKCASNFPWTEEIFLQALKDCDLVPQADPNTSSHTQRVMKVIALKQLQAASQQLYDPIAVDTVALQALGFSNPSQFFAPQTGQPPPEQQAIMAELQNEKQAADAKTTEANAKTEIAKAHTAEVQAKAAQGAYAPKSAGLGGVASFNPLDVEKLKLEKQDLGLKAAQIQADSQNQAADRSQEHEADVMRFVTDIAKNEGQMRQAAQQAQALEKRAGATSAPKKNGAS